MEPVPSVGPNSSESKRLKKSPTEDGGYVRKRIAEVENKELEKLAMKELRRNLKGISFWKTPSIFSPSPRVRQEIPF